MLIEGCCCCGDSDPGALGFSNERSLVYCASTFNWGGAPASGGVPLPLVMKGSPGAVSSAVRSAMGYHRPAVFHKDDHLQVASRDKSPKPGRIPADDILNN